MKSGRGINVPTTLRTEDIYEAAFDPEASGRLPVLLAQACGGRSAMLAWFGAEGGADVLDYSYFSPQMMQQYAETFADHDLWAKVAFSKRYINGVTIGDVGVTESAFEGSVLFNEFFRKNGDDTFYAVGGAHLTTWGTALVGVHRNRRAGSFDEADAKRLGGIVKHLRGALTLRGRLASERKLTQAGQAAWDATTLASVVVRRDGRIVQHNEAAEIVLRRADVFKAVNNVLCAISQDQQGRLMRAIGLATAPVEPSGSSLRLETVAGVEYLISIAPISRRSGPSVALILFKDPLASPDTLQGQLQAVWGLTPREALVAAELAQGRAIPEIAARRGVSQSTVKAQLKAISIKMNAHGQAELIAKIRMLP